MRKIEQTGAKPICGIHTMSLWIDGLLPAQMSEEAINCISRDYPHIDSKTGEVRTKIVLNANHWQGENGWCQSWSDYRAILNEILSEIGTRSYSLNRVDFAINFVEDNYNALHKKHKCICLLAASHYKAINKYESIDPLILQHLTTRIQNEYIEIENYNKKIESFGKSPFANRLELRSKALDQKKVNFHGMESLIDDWNRKFNSFISHYEEMISNCNGYILNRWNLEQKTRVKDMSEFIRKYEDNIFSTEQLTALYTEMGVKSSKSSVKNFKRYNKIEFTPKEDISSYFDLISKLLKEYVSNGAVTALKSGAIKCA